MPPPESTSTYGLETPTREHVSVFSVLRRRALIILVATLLAGAAAAAFAYATRDTYESTSKLLFSQTIGPAEQALGLIPGTPDADNLAQSNLQLVDSREVAAETARRLRDEGWDVSTDDVENDVAVNAARDTDVVEITATAESARRAAQLATTYAERAAAVASNAQREQAQRVLANVEEQLAQLPPAQRLGREGLRLREDAQRLRTLAEVGTGSPRVIQRGFVPSSRSGNPIQTIVLGVLFGLLLGVGLALVREQSDRKLRRTEQVTAAFEAPVLTTVPRSRALKRHRPFADLPPQVAEAFRMLQMNLRFARAKPVRSVMVTSARTGEGKTTVSWNLAAAAASGGLSAVLVEADLRRPSVAERYGLDGAPGLTELLQGDVSIAVATQEVAPTAGISNGATAPQPLHVVVAGQGVPNPSALSQSSATVRMLEVLRREYDLVVIDTPPLPHVADAIALLRHVDGVLVTASVNSTRGPDAVRLRDQLQGLDANVLGVVANGGSALRGYSAYARTPVLASTEGNGRPRAPITVATRSDRTEELPPDR